MSRAKTALQIIRWSFVAAPLAVIGRWWSEGITNMPTTSHNEKISIQEKVSEQRLRELKSVVQEEFKPITLIYGYRGNMEACIHQFTAKEAAFIGSKINDWTILDYCDKPNGLRAVYFLDNKTGQTTLSIAGGDLGSGPKEFSKDIGKVFMTTAGGTTGQFEDLVAFAERISKIRPPDNICGHSLGGHLGQCLAPLFPKANVTIYDPPGLTYTMERELSQFYSEHLHRPVPKQEIDDRMRNVMRVRITDNAYNSLGVCGIDLTTDAHPAYNPYDISQLLPAKHFYGKRSDHGYFALITSDKMQLSNADQSRYSAGPVDVTAALALASITALVGPELLKRRRKDQELDQDKSKSAVRA